MLRIIEKESIRRIHTHQEIELFYAVLLKIFTPRLQIFHSVHLYNPSFNWVYFLELISCLFVKRILPVSHSLRRKLVAKRYPARKMTVLYNGVKIPQTNRNGSQNIFAEKISISSGDFVILMTGNFKPEKDHLTLVKAFYLLKENHSHLKLVFIGQENKHSQPCRKSVNPDDLDHRVFFLGPIPSAWRFVEFCNLFVFSSRTETFGIAAIEALLMKTPVLASDIDVMQELSHKGRYFRLFETGNEQDLARNIEWFIEVKNQQVIQKTIEKAHRYAEDEFSYNSFVSRLAQVYRA